MEGRLGNRGCRMVGCFDGEEMIAYAAWWVPKDMKEDGEKGGKEGEEGKEGKKEGKEGEKKQDWPAGTNVALVERVGRELDVKRKEIMGEEGREWCMYIFSRLCFGFCVLQSVNNDTFLCPSILCILSRCSLNVSGAVRVIGLLVFSRVPRLFL